VAKMQLNNTAQTAVLGDVISTVSFLNSFRLQEDFRKASPESSKAAVQEGVRLLKTLQSLFKEKACEMPNTHS